MFFFLLAKFTIYCYCLDINKETSANELNMHFVAFDLMMGKSLSARFEENGRKIEAGKGRARELLAISMGFAQCISRAYKKNDHFALRQMRFLRGNCCTALKRQNSEKVSLFESSVNLTNDEHQQIFVRVKSFTAFWDCLKAVVVCTFGGLLNARANLH